MRIHIWPEHNEAITILCEHPLKLRRVQWQSRQREHDKLLNEIIGKYSIHFHRIDVVLSGKLNFAIGKLSACRAESERKNDNRQN